MFMIFRRIVVLIRKELQMLLNDRQSRMLLVMPVIIQLVLFPLAATLEVKNAALAVYDQDAGPSAVELLQRLGGARHTFSRIVMLRSETELTNVIEEQRALAAIRIPPDFSRRLARGEATQLQIIVDGRRSNSGQIAANYIQQIVTELAADKTDAGQGRGGVNGLVVRNWFNPNLDYQTFVLPSLIAIIAMIGTLVVSGLSVAREREQGTFDQLLVSPLTPEMIMVGKIVPALIVAIFQSSLILVAAVFIYRVSFEGNLLMLYSGILLYTLSLAGIGLFISSLCQTQQQALLASFSFLMPSVTLSGFIAPVENMPAFFQYASWGNPVWHFMEVVKSVYLKNATWSHFMTLAWPLVAISAVTLTIAGVAFRRRVA